MISFILKGLILLNVYALMWVAVDLSFDFIYGFLAGVLASWWVLAFVAECNQQRSDE